MPPRNDFSPRKLVVATSAKEDKNRLLFSFRVGDILELCTEGKERQQTTSKGLFCMRAKVTVVFQEVFNAAGHATWISDTAYREATMDETEKHFRNIFSSHTNSGDKRKMVNRISAIIGSDPSLADVFLKAVCSTVENENISEIETAIYAVKECMETPQIGNKTISDTLRRQAKAGPVAEKFKKLVKDGSDGEETDDTDADSFEQYADHEK